MDDNYEEKSESAKGFGQDMENMMEEHAHQKPNIKINQTNTVDFEVI